MNSKNGLSLIKLFLSILLCLGGGWLTGLLTEYGVKEWYPHLIKPHGTPPDIVFPVVWTILYITMGVSLALLWSSPHLDKKKSFFLFFLQLFLNFIWSGIFFSLQSPGLALIDLVLLWFTLILTIGAFWHHTRLGSILLVPYFCWVSYAFYLNLFIWLYN